MKYLRYYLTPVLVLFVAIGILLGGGFMWLGFAGAAIIIVFGDALLGNDVSQPDYKHKFLLELPLFMSLPALICLMLVLAFSASKHDFLGLGAWFGSLTGIDILARRAHNDVVDYIGAVMSCGLLVAGYATNVAHELIHQVKKPRHYIVGRWLLAASGNADFAIEHVFGHHVHVGTPRDPATARRGENVYAFVVRSAYQGHFSAWRIELGRLAKKQQSPFSLHNQMITGYLMTLAWMALFFVAAGPLGVLLFVLQGLLAKFLLEVVNYLEHYGLQRRPGTSVGPEHSWNSNRRMSSLILYSLVRHSAHHQKASVPFWKLNPYPEAPELPHGYLTTILLCLVPPLWFYIMDERLTKWDDAQHSASLSPQA